MNEYAQKLFTDEAGISKQAAIFWYSSLTLLKPDIRPVGLPWANWQWKTSLGVSPFDEFVVERWLLEEYEGWRFDVTEFDEPALVGDDDVVVSEMDGMIPLIGSSFFAWDFRRGGKIGMLNSHTRIN